MLDRAKVVDENFINHLRNDTLPKNLKHANQPLPFSELTLLRLFDSQIKSRLLDLIARELKDKGQSFYTIGSSGHEGNAVLGAVFPYTDMAFLHYRSGAFFIERSKQLEGLDGAQDIMLSLVASSEDKISAGRHKVFGSLPLNIPPQTSTIASHLPKALGTAVSIRRAQELGIRANLKDDSVVLCSFGDASLNHASTQTTLNACSWLSTGQYPLPIVFICEDNGTGISVKTPKNWVRNSVQDRVGIHYLEADGLDVIDGYLVAQQAQNIVRHRRQAVFLHWHCARLMGHAGSDIESQYLSQSEIERQEARDPLLITASYLQHFNVMAPVETLELYQSIRADLWQMAEECISKPKLTSKEMVVQSLIPTKANSPIVPYPDEQSREKYFADKFKQLQLKRTLQQNINFALTDILLRYQNTVIFGEDVGKKGGVYRVTADLQKQFGQRRVFDSLLDETTILGSAIGFAHNGFLPIPEIQFLAYFHNAEDQLRGEAATLSFFSDGQYQNPMVIRIASFAYQKGFGGHFHNDNSIAVLRDLPGVIIAAPSNGADAAKLLRECVRLAHEEKRIVVFLEPIALYMTKDLHQPKDDLWQCVYPEPEEQLPLGEVGVFGEGELCIISYANGYYLSRQAAHILEQQHNMKVKVIDLRWLAPLPIEAILREVKSAKQILVVDEGRRTGSISEAIITALVENLDVLPLIKRLTGEDTFIPLGNAWQYVLPSKEQIVEMALSFEPIHMEGLG
jgi:2-oxoisovalerate dehydrogenase E1 component